jgi:hypothetical protein
VVDRVLVWIKIPGPVLELWDDKFMWDLSKFLGHTASVESSYKKSVYFLVARVLLDIDLKEGLEESIEIAIGDKVITHILDYPNIPFHGVRCHNYGHMVIDCMKPFIKKSVEKEND